MNGSGQLAWEVSQGPDESAMYAADLSGHFWAEVRQGDGGRWSFVVWDYQNNDMVSGTAESADGARAAVEGWNDWVINADGDPSREWPDPDASGQRPDVREVPLAALSCSGLRCSACLYDSLVTRCAVAVCLAVLRSERRRAAICSSRCSERRVGSAARPSDLPPRPRRAYNLTKPKR